MPNQLLRQFFDENDARVDAIVAKFATYQPHSFTRGKLLTWLDQFDPADYDLLLRVLEHVRYYDFPEIIQMLKELHRAIRQEAIDEGIRPLKQMIFFPMGDPGESSHEVFRRYRDVNKLTQIPVRRVLVPNLQQAVIDAQSVGDPVAVVTVDDFVGTGAQLKDYWEKVLTQVVPPPHPFLYVETLVACDNGITEVHGGTPLRIVTGHYAPPAAFLNEAPNFNENEKERIRTYCQLIGNQPSGFGGLELLLAFTHGCPDNTISLLRGSRGQHQFKGILPRFGDLP